MTRVCILLTRLLLLFPAAAFPAPEIREGLWEISIQADMGGQAMTETPMVVRQCMSQQSVQELMAKMGGAGACRISDMEQTGSHAKWKLTCSGQLDVSGTGETDMGNDEFTGRMNLAVGMAGQSIELAQSFKARRVGECQ